MATVMLDAGHGGYDSGAVYGERYTKSCAGSWNDLRK